MNERGENFPVSLPRRMVDEFLHHARQIPTLPLSRVCSVAALQAARKRMRPSPSWTAIFIRAYGLVAQEIPELRRAWIRYPWPHIYEHACSTCAVVVEREYEGEKIVLSGKVFNPVGHTLSSIDEALRNFRDLPVWDISEFRQIIRLGRMPRFLRRFLIWSTLHFNGFKRARRFGTFLVSSLGNFGVEQHHPLTVLTTYFTFGPISSDGDVTLKIVYDHRVMDGRQVARALVRLDETLRTVILDEMASPIRLAA